MFVLKLENFLTLVMHINSGKTLFPVGRIGPHPKEAGANSLAAARLRVFHTIINNLTSF